MLWHSAALVFYNWGQVGAMALYTAQVVSIGYWDCSVVDWSCCTCANLPGDRSTTSNRQGEPTEPKRPNDPDCRELPSPCPALAGGANGPAMSICSWVRGATLVVR
mmetsp:Transcript_4196/g.7344  ORF Transcript_4196/g.7344 Transcript_4196/m.7344 type:complete len:106 (+) Transcript_4196:329-646(+)